MVIDINDLTIAVKIISEKIVNNITTWCRMCMEQIL